MYIKNSEPVPMETISHMDMLGRKCARNGAGRRIYHGIIRMKINERIPSQKELTLKPKVWHFQLVCNKSSANTKSSPLLNVGIQIRHRFLCHINYPSSIKTKRIFHLPLTKQEGKIEDT